MSKDRLRRAIGCADACELIFLALSFPSDDLALALADGRFFGDVSSCLSDAGSRAGRIAAPVFEADELRGNLRKGYSILFLAPGLDTPVFPYESAFRFVAAGKEGVPPIFNSPVTLSVERHMRDAGVLPKDVRTEPADSVWSELSFMSYLYGQVAKALHEGRASDAGEWSDRVVRFWDDHASRWLHDFMRKTVEEAPRHSFGAEYAVLAETGLLVLDAIAGDVESRRGL